MLIVIRYSYQLADVFFSFKMLVELFFLSQRVKDNIVIRYSDKGGGIELSSSSQ